MIQYFIDRIRRVLAFISVFYYVNIKTSKKGITKDDDSNIILWIPKFGWRYYINEKVLTSQSTAVCWQKQLARYLL